MDDNLNQNQPQPVRPSTPAQRYSVEKKADGTIVVKINVPAADVEKNRAGVVDELVKNVEVQGFRKGAAPRNLAEQKLGKQTIQEEVVRKVISEEYIAAVKQLNLRPIINPRVHIEPFEDGTNLAFTAETCEEPKVVLGSYKEEVKKIKPVASAPAAPNAPLQAGEATNLRGQNQPNPQAEVNRKLDQILGVVLKTANITIPPILVQNEADRLLSQLLDELKRLGVSLDQYLSSRQKTAEQLRGEYEERATTDLKLEFILRKIADEEKIVVEEVDVQKAMAQIQDPEERKQIAKNPYMVGAIIRQQKTLDFLSKL